MGTCARHNNDNSRLRINNQKDTDKVLSVGILFSLYAIVVNKQSSVLHRYQKKVPKKLISYT